MCIFSGAVEEVKNTRIFAREVEKGVQGLVYQMDVSIAQEVAMVLPLPIKTPAWENAVRFLNFEEYDDFFSQLHRLFPVPRSRGSDSFSATPDQVDTLKVIEVGSYVASFVPTQRDFRRLDQRFRVSSENWAKFPQYHDYGFAVFQLKAGKKRIHPMALVFESRLKGLLYFPTAHIHDGAVHAKEQFDHTLYAQGWLNSDFEEKDWLRSRFLAGQTMTEEKSQGLIWGKGRVFRKKLRGELLNKDQFLAGWT